MLHKHAGSLLVVFGLLFAMTSGALAQTTITVSSWAAHYIEPLVEAFNAKQDRIKAEAVVLHPDAVMTRLATGLGPDIIHYHVGYYTYDMESQWADLTEVVSRHVDRSEWIPGFWEALTMPAGEYAGQIRRVRTFYEIPVLFYDKDKVAFAGLAEPPVMHQQGRWTWDDMLAHAQKLTVDTDGDGTANVWGIAHDVSYGWNNSGFYEIWALQNGGYILDDHGEYIADQPAFVDAVQWWADLYHRHRVSPAARPSINTLAQGQSAMTIYGTQAPTTWAGYETWDMAPLPNLPEGRPYNYAFEHSSWVVNGSSDNLDAALEFIEFVLSEEGVGLMSEIVGFFPAHFGVMSSFLQSQEERYPWTEYIEYTLVSTVETATMPRRPGPWHVPNWRHMVNLINQAVQSVQAGEQPAAIAMQQVGEPIRALLEMGREQIVPGM